MDTQFLESLETASEADLHGIIDDCTNKLQQDPQYPLAKPVIDVVTAVLVRRFPLGIEATAPAINLVIPEQPVTPPAPIAGLPLVTKSFPPGSPEFVCNWSANNPKPR